jgi:hypothetical protein
MDELGPSLMDVTVASQIKGLLQNEKEALLENDIKLAPSWIAKELFNLVSSSQFKHSANELV